MQEIFDFFVEYDIFAKHCGIVLKEIGPGWATAEMVIRDFHLNGAKTVHGGAIFTLADYVFAVASNGRGKLALAIDTSMSFINASTEGTLYAEAKELFVSRRLGRYEVTITDGRQRLIGRFYGTAYRKDSVKSPFQQNKGAEDG